jgi:hypothetical protein
MADSPNREEVRDALTELVEAALSSTVVKVYNYSTVDIGNQSPVVLVFSDGTNRLRRQGFGPDSKFDTFARLRVQAYVALPGKDDKSYTQRDAEDLLDLIDKQIADVVTAHSSHEKWRSLNYEEGFSRPEDVLMSGSPYIREEWALIAGLPY